MNNADQLILLNFYFESVAERAARRSTPSKRTTYPRQKPTTNTDKAPMNSLAHVCFRYTLSRIMRLQWEYCLQQTTAAASKQAMTVCTPLCYGMSTFSNSRALCMYSFTHNTVCNCVRPRAPRCMCVQACLCLAMEWKSSVYLSECVIHVFAFCVRYAVCSLCSEVDKVNCTHGMCIHIAWCWGITCSILLWHAAATMWVYVLLVVFFLRCPLWPPQNSCWNLKLCRDNVFC